MTDADQEGWFTDPFLLHDERWLSNGRPTKLAKDAGVESLRRAVGPGPGPDSHPDRSRSEGHGWL